MALISDNGQEMNVSSLLEGHSVEYMVMCSQTAEVLLIEEFSLYYRGRRKKRKKKKPAVFTLNFFLKNRQKYKIKPLVPKWERFHDA